MIGPLYGGLLKGQGAEKEVYHDECLIHVFLYSHPWRCGAAGERPDGGRWMDGWMGGGEKQMFFA